MEGVSSKLMWVGFAMFAFGIMLGSVSGGSVLVSALVFLGVIIYLIGAFELADQLHDTESDDFTNTSADILATHVDENDKLMLTGLGIFLLGAGMVATGSLPVKFGFIAALGGLIMYVGGALSCAVDLNALEREA